MYLASMLAHPSGFTTSQFLQAILPSISAKELTFAIGFHEQGSDYGVYERHAALAADCLIPDESQLGGWNVWFTPSAFLNGKRTQANAQAAQSLWTDLDVDPSGQKPGTYKSVQDAWTALWQFAQATGFHPHLIVDSGRGIQAFWLLGRPVASAEWSQLALRMAVVMQTNGLQYDRSRATDIASWMRLPGVQNPKPGARRAMVVHSAGHARFAPEQLMQAWGGVDISSMISELAGKSHGPQVNIPPEAMHLTGRMDLGELLNSWEDFCTNANGAHCPRVAWAIHPQNQGYISEPEWYNLLGFFRTFAGGRQLAHMASQYHPGYSPEATDRKFMQWQGHAPSKATFQNKLTNIPGAPSCATCVNAHACKSPAQWGRRVEKVIPIAQAQPEPQAPAPAPAVHVTVSVPQPMEDSPAMMSAEFDYGRAGEAWGMWTSITRETATGDKETRIHLCKQRIYPRRITRVRQSDTRGVTTQETCLHVDVVASDNSARPMFIPLADLDSQHKNIMIRALHDAGCTNPGHSWNHAGPIEWKGFMSRLLIQARTLAMSATGLPETAHSHLGWTDADDGSTATSAFVLGGYSYSDNGAVATAVVDAHVAQFARGVPAPMTEQSYPGGTQALAADFKRLLGASLPQGEASMPDQFAIASSLATCLQALCVPEIERGGVVVFHNDGSGTGKTSLLRRAMSVWTAKPGDWIQQDATMQGFVEKRLQVAHSLPVVWDDMIRTMGRDDAHRFAEFVLRSTGKQQRVRQTTSSQGSWTTYAFASMNPDPHALISMDSRDASNALNRVLGISVPPGRLSSATRPAQAAYDDWCDQYGGMVGQLFLRSVLSQQGRELTRTRYEAWRGWLRTELKSDDANERFNRSICASALTAAELATQLGLVDFNMQAMMQFVLGLMQRTVATVASSVATSGDLATDFLAAIQHGTAHLQVSSDGGTTTVVSLPNSSIKANRIKDGRHDTHYLLIPASVVREWAGVAKVNPQAIENALTSNFKATATFAGFYSGSSSATTRVWMLPLPPTTNPLENVCSTPTAPSPHSPHQNAIYAGAALPSQQRAMYH